LFRLRRGAGRPLGFVVTANAVEEPESEFLGAELARRESLLNLGNGRRGHEVFDPCEAVSADPVERFGKGRKIELAEPRVIRRSRDR
jgi:hypothetical protein